jgi:hypothetical protein
MLANVMTAFTSSLSFAARSWSRVSLIIRSFASEASKLKHFCEVVVHVSPVPNKQHYNLVLVVVYFVDGSVVAYSQTVKIRKLQLFSSFFWAARKLLQRRFDSRPVCRVHFLQCLRSFRVQKHLKRQKA